MIVRKFEASNLEDALKLVKNAMGPEALILSTKTKDKGWFGSCIEVAAALAPKPEPAPQPAPKKLLSTSKVYNEIKNKLIAKRDPKTEPLKESDFAEIKPRRLDPVVKVEKSEDQIYFEKRGFCEASARDFAGRIVMETSRAERSDAEFMHSYRVKLVTQGIKTLAPEILTRRRGWVLIGNPGVGKTATAVKLALHLKSQKQTLHLVSSDKKKLSGEQELANYARLIQVPFQSESIKTPIGIEIHDTPGMGYMSKELAEKMEQTCRESSVILVLDAGQRLDELLHRVEEVEALTPMGLFFTRADLVKSLGVVYDVLKITKLPLLGMSVSGSFKVPVKFFEPKTLADWILTHPKNPLVPPIRSTPVLNPQNEVHV